MFYAFVYAERKIVPRPCTTAEERGETIFSDAIRAARILRESQPEHFKALSTLPVTFHKIEKGVFMRCVSTGFNVRKANHDPN